jgi:hypothetical protein
VADKFLEQLKRKRATTEDAQPHRPEETPEETPSERFADPEARAALLEDQLTNTREELEAERQQRLQAERRLEAQTRPTTLAGVLHGLRRQRGAGRHW